MPSSAAVAAKTGVVTMLLVLTTLPITAPGIRSRLSGAGGGGWVRQALAIQRGSSKAGGTELGPSRSSVAAWLTSWDNGGACPHPPWPWAMASTQESR
jgi:hypothetical protein